MQIIFFNKKSEKFFESLEILLRSRTESTLQLLKKHGNNLGMPHSKPLGRGLFELRVTGITHVRFIYTFYENNVCILHGFIKKTNKISKGDISYEQKQLKLLLQ